MDYCIVYYSRSDTLRSEADLVSLLNQSRLYNAETNITGILLFVQGSIIQAIEGEEAIVKALYEKIGKDTRHCNVVKVVSQPIKDRSFSNWSMGYKTISRQQLGIVKTLIELSDTDWLRTKPSDNVIINMLKLYFENSIYN